MRRASVVGLTFIGVLLLPAAAAAQTGADVAGIPRTPWGAPDLMGYWTYDTTTPCSAPPSWRARRC